MGLRDIGARSLEFVPESGFGFTQARRTQALQQLQRGFTEETPEQAALRGQLREAVGRRLASIGGPQQRAALEAGLQRGTEASLAQARRQLGGAGALGTPLAGGAAAEAVQRAQQARAQGLLDLERQQGAELAGLTGLGGALGQQELGARQFRLGQFGTLAQLLQQQAQGELGRQSGLRSVGLGGVEALGPSDLERGLGTALQIGGTVAGLGLPGGGSVGGALLAGQNKKIGGIPVF